MFFLYLALFPLVGILCAIYILNKNSWMIDLNAQCTNASNTLCSLLFGVTSEKKVFFQNDDVSCFHTAPSSETISSSSSSNSNRTTTVRQKSSSASKLKATPIDYLLEENFSYHQSPCEGTARPLLVLFAWLFAKERHLDKYREFYMERGFDVLSIKLNVRDFLIPQSGSQHIAHLTVKFLSDYRDRYRAYIFHAFSVGVYQLGELLVLLNKESHKEANSETKSLLKGMIFDSVLDIDEAPLGLSKATTNNAFLQWSIMTLMNAHLRLCYQLATKHYICSSQAVRANKFRSPTLVFLSKDDEVANYEHQFKIIDKWRLEGLPVITKCWDHSPHVSHFFKHPDEYRSFLDDFLKNEAKVL